MPQFLTVQQIAERFIVKEQTVLAFINSGELPAMNIALAGAKSGKPRWRIRLSDVESFETSRTKKREPDKVSKPVKRAKTSTNTVEFFRNGRRVAAG